MQENKKKKNDFENQNPPEQGSFHSDSDNQKRAGRQPIQSAGQSGSRHKNPENPENGGRKTAPKKKKRKRRLTRLARLLLAGVCVLMLGVSFYYYWQHETQKNVTLTYLDSISLGQLSEVPQATFEENIEVQDFTIYGNSLVFYDRTFSPLETDTFFGRSVTLRNIKDGSTITTAFTGGADAGIDLEQLPQGVYEVYLSDGYTPKRAYMPETTLPKQFVTTRNDGTVKKINIVASPNYLSKFNLQSDKPYLFLSVTESEPVETAADVVIDPMGYGSAAMDEQSQEDRLADGFSEYEQSWILAGKIRQRLESAGLKVIYSQSQSDDFSYQGDPSRVSAGYDAQAKVYLSLGMVNEDFNFPFVVSSPFTNGKLGNMIVQELNAYGVQLETVSTLTQLNAGNGYDQLSYDQNMQNSPFSVTASIRETGGKVTSAGKEEGWQSNAKYSDAYGMNAVFFAYASTASPSSRTYYLEHVDAIADGIAKGILDYGHITKTWNLEEDSSTQTSLADPSAVPAQPAANPAASQMPPEQPENAAQDASQPEPDPADQHPSDKAQQDLPNPDPAGQEEVPAGT